MIKKIVPLCLILVACGGEEESTNQQSENNTTSNVEIEENNKLVPSTTGVKETVQAIKLWQAVKNVN